MYMLNPTTGELELDGDEPVIAETETPRYVIVDANGDAKKGELEYNFTVVGLDAACARLGELESMGGDAWSQANPQPWFIANPANQTVAGCRYHKFGLTGAEISFINNVWGWDWE